MQNIRKKIWMHIYYCFAIILPANYTILGKWLCTQQIRYFICKHIFKKTGNNVNIEKGARFGNGFDLVIGNNSGLGVNCSVPSNIIVGNDVMMGPNCMIFSQNHSFLRMDIPMRQQGYTLPLEPTIIEDDVWIGYGVIITPGKIIKKGSIIGAGCVLTKNFPEYSVIGGNPAKLLKKRNDNV